MKGPTTAARTIGPQYVAGLIKGVRWYWDYICEAKGL